MNEKEAREAFVRWQGITRDQIGFLNNLLIGLTTGLLAFETQIAFNSNASLSYLNKILFVFSILSLTASVTIGIEVAYKRLVNFRKTTKINRERKEGKTKVDENLKKDTGELGEKTWKLLEWQIRTFAVGGLLLIFATLIKYIFG